ncbi:MAG: hypothetical protein SGCHY_004380, partial [Lobulomycetales sp.]
MAMTLLPDQDQDFIVSPKEFLESVVFDFALVVPHSVSSESPPLEWLSSMSLQSPTPLKFAEGIPDTGQPWFMNKTRASSIPNGMLTPPLSPVHGLKATRPKKLFACDQCPKVFSRAYALSSHMTSHSDERPYQCELCPTKFKRIWDYKRHKT